MVEKIEKEQDKFQQQKEERQQQRGSRSRGSRSQSTVGKEVCGQLQLEKEKKICKTANKTNKDCSTAFVAAKKQLKVKDLQKKRRRKNSKRRIEYL